MKYILAIDQGTTSSRAILFDDKLDMAFVAQEEFTQHFPKPGWVEHNPDDIWDSVLSVCNNVIRQAGISGNDILSIGISNQRETTLIWNKKTGKPLQNAIVWLDRRTSDMCNQLRTDGHQEMITKINGLLLDTYFSGTKVKWLIENNAEIKIDC